MRVFIARPPLGIYERPNMSTAPEVWFCGLESGQDDPLSKKYALKAIWELILEAAIKEKKKTPGVVLFNWFGKTTKSKRPTWCL